jgi:hypothetical protein
MTTTLHVRRNLPNNQHSVEDQSRRGAASLSPLRVNPREPLDAILLDMSCSARRPFCVREFVVTGRSGSCQQTDLPRQRRKLGRSTKGDSFRGGRATKPWPVASFELVMLWRVRQQVEDFRLFSSLGTCTHPFSFNVVTYLPQEYNCCAQDIVTDESLQLLLCTRLVKFWHPFTWHATVWTSKLPADTSQ